MALIEMKHIGKQYGAGDRAVSVLDDVSLTVEAGEMVAVLGRSGSGKSTLMNLLGCLDMPSCGTYRLNGKSVTDFSERQLASVRSRTVGFVFQNFRLLPQLSALENVELPLQYQGVSRAQRYDMARDVLCRVGLEHRLRHRPSELSGGQQQRVAIARAIVGHPSILLADEPTGNLDTAAGEEVFSLLHRWHEAGNTVILITHDSRMGRACPRQMTMTDGKLTPGQSTDY